MTAQSSFNYEVFCEKLKSLRRNKGLTLREAGDTSGIAPNHIWQLEKGRVKDVRVSTVWALAATYGVNPGYLLGLENLNQSVNPLVLKIARLISEEVQNTVAGIA